MNFCVEQSGNEGTKDARAKSWQHWGKHTTKPVRGCADQDARKFLTYQLGPGQGEEEADMTPKQATQLEAIFQALTVPGTSSPEDTVNMMFTRIKNIEAAINVEGTSSAVEAFDLLFDRVRTIEKLVMEINNKLN